MWYKRNNIKEPLILEKEHHNETLWLTYCSLFGVPSTSTKIIISGDKVEYFSERKTEE